LSNPQSHLRRIGAALEQEQFRYFLAGSFLSNVGSWMQSVAQAWLMYSISNSAFYLGLDGFANTIPITVFAFWGGVIADRVDRRKLLIYTQWFLLALALILGALAQMNQVRIWEILLFSFFTGLTQAVAWPVYQAVMGSIVPRRDLPNAIALNSLQFNLARTIGPILGALGLRWFGTAGCFYANAVSFVAVIEAVRRVTIPAPESPAPIPKSMLHSLNEGLRYMMKSRALLWLLLLLASTSILGVPLVTLLPVYARDILKIGSSGLGILVGSFGAGAVIGAFAIAWRGDFQRKGVFVLNMILLFVVSQIAFSYSKWLPLSVTCLLVAGYSMIGFAAVINSLVQSSVPDHLRGRAVSIFVFSFGGCMPLGNLLAGWLAKVYGAPLALLGQGILLGCFVLYVYMFHRDVHSLT
jgi:MFS family permease